ncbi:MAG TPA: MarR family transcriptional regulator [Candidatus Limnocylindrales bacterium]|jgi:DNA-binding MarR family transcriptional regulator|nr:MarR family transcriptional regulator [Candidatus Limnocylindrales bacterium]
MTPNERTDPSGAAAGAAEAVERVIVAYEAFMHGLMATHAPDMHEVDITMAQARALYIVLATGQLRMSELAAAMRVTSSTATGQVDRLVELGLLERLADPADRRQVVVRTTPAAVERLEHLRELNTHRMRELLAGLSLADLRTVERAIAILQRGVDAAPTTADPSTGRAPSLPLLGDPR